MKSLLDGLPPEVARRIHPDWRKNETDYWVQRDRLLSQYRDHWIAFAQGSVIVSGTSPVDVLHDARQSAQHPYVTCVGHEHEPCRMRRQTFEYDTGYLNEALPLMNTEFRKDIDESGLLRPASRSRLQLAPSNSTVYLCPCGRTATTEPTPLSGALPAMARSLIHAAEPTVPPDKKRCANSPKDVSPKPRGHRGLPPHSGAKRFSRHRSIAPMPGGGGKTSPPGNRELICPSVALGIQARR
ncbi:MAG: hypothetical protein GY856_12180 [bacterium]|nr:hypothetical protein [bacterium]